MGESGLKGELAYSVEQLVVVDIAFDAFIENLTGKNAAFATLGCKIQFFTDLTKLSGAIGYGFTNLAVSDGFA